MVLRTAWFNRGSIPQVGCKPTPWKGEREQSHKHVLLAQRLDIGAQLLARVQPEATKIGVNVLALEVKDVMFPADLKRAFADVLKAKQEGQAALERARGESASLRNLANAARVLEGNPALMNLRLTQSLTTAQKAGTTLVLGVPGGFVPLQSGKLAASSEQPNES
jgi:hypothetical protein